MDTSFPKSPAYLADAIRAEAFRLGFSACGFARVEPVDAGMDRFFFDWLEAGCQAQMTYMENHRALRNDPALLYEGARTVICVALNYYPPVFQPASHPQFALYAYGRDYHEVMRERLNRLSAFVSSLSGDAGRVCCDTAPVYERYWAHRAGIGFIGKNGQLIVPHRGSYFFLGELFTRLDLPADSPVENRCGDCTRCLDHCPTGALSRPGVVDARLCISCQTIENRDEIPESVASRMGNRVYGCDTCQTVCPWNRFAEPTGVTEFHPNEEFLALDEERMRALTPETYSRVFSHSAVKRAKFAGLQRNLAALVRERDKKK